MRHGPALLLALLLALAGTACAQDNEQDNQQNGHSAANRRSPGDRLFLPPPLSIGIRYRIPLGNGNILRIDLANGYDLRKLANIDSILNLFLDDMNAFSDSLADPLTVKIIDYLIDTSGKKKLRIRQYRPEASSFLLDHHEPSILRVEQDTVRILIVTAAPRRDGGRTVNGLRYDRFCFFLNHYSELESYAEKGLDGWTRHILSTQAINPRHPYRCPFCYLVGDSGITTRAAQGNALSINPGAAVQNYKNYFAPAFAAGARLILTRDDNRYYIGASWEPVFLFAPDAGGRLQTYRNDFVVLTYEHDRGGTRVNNIFDPACSIAYLFHREGDYFSKPGFRLSAGKGKIGDVHIEPCLYFNNFFRGVTPSLRVSIGGF